MKARNAALAMFAATLIVIGGCDIVGTNGGSTASFSPDKPLYNPSSTPLALPLAPDSTVFFTTEIDTTGYE